MIKKSSERYVGGVGRLYRAGAYSSRPLHTVKQTLSKRSLELSKRSERSLDNPLSEHSSEGSDDGYKHRTRREPEPVIDRELDFPSEEKADVRGEWKGLRLHRVEAAERVALPVSFLYKADARDEWG